MLKLITKPSFLWLKRVITIAGLLLFLPGIPLAFGFFCITFILVVEGDNDAITVGLGSFTLMLLTLGAGGAAFWHGLCSLRGKISKPLYLPAAWAITGIFGLIVVMGLFITENNFAAGLLFPPILIVAAALPPLLAIVWFTNQDAGGLTWRQAVIAFAGGATVSVVVAIILEILFPAVFLALVFNLAEVITESIEEFLEALAGKNVASAITGSGFIYVFIQVAIIAPLAEELAKPLVTLPLIGRLSRRNAFLVGAMAGAGFATLENILYASFGFYFWAGILLVRALGGAIHPLGSGVVALSWRDVLQNEPKAWLKWFACFGLATGMHALWNGGSLLVITLAGAQFFGELPPEIDILGLSAAGTTLALLIILGLIALWLGRSIARRARLLGISDSESTIIDFTLSDKSAAIWALTCLVVILPAGIASLRLLIQ